MKKHWPIYSVVLVGAPILASSLFLLMLDGAKSFTDKHAALNVALLAVLAVIVQVQHSKRAAAEQYTFQFIRDLMFSPELTRFTAKTGSFLSC